MRFWCSNDGRNWTWEWQPYWGAWLMVAALAWAYWRGGVFAADQPAKRKAGAVVGMFLLLAGIDWPLAKLGAGYLVTAQMIRQIIIVMIACPLLLWSAPPAVGRWLVGGPKRKSLYRLCTNPRVTLPVALGLLIAVTAPLIVERFVRSQIGSFGMDIVWMLAGVLIWLPVQPPRPLRARLQGPPLVVYLIVVSVVPLPVAFFMTWSEFPIFEVYENSPRVFDVLTAADDQQLGSAIFQVVGGLVIWVQIGARFISMSNEGKPQPKYRGRLVTSTPTEGDSTP